MACFPGFHQYGDWRFTYRNPQLRCEVKKTCERCGHEKYDVDHDWHSIKPGDRRFECNRCGVGSGVGYGGQGHG